MTPNRAGRVRAAAPKDAAAFRFVLAAALVAVGGSLPSSRAEAQEYASVLAGCWLAADGGNDQLMLDPGGSFMMAGEVGTWTAEAESIAMQSRRDRWEIWDLSLSDGVLTLSSPRERRRRDGGETESAPDRERSLALRRARFSECGRVPTYPAPEESDPPALFVQTPPSIILTNRLRNDPVEVRVIDGQSIVVCEILSDTCQPVDSASAFFTATDPQLIPTASGGRASGSIRLWRVAGGDVSRGDLVRLAGSPCLPEDAEACHASQGYVTLAFDQTGQPVAGWVVLGSTLEPGVERALLVPAAGDAPPVLWVETARYVRERGEFFWQAFTVSLVDELLGIVSQAGPFATGAQVVVSREPTPSGQTQECTNVVRSTPAVDGVDGRVRLATQVESGAASAYHLELAWSTEVDRYQAVALVAGDPPPTERVCRTE